MTAALNVLHQSVGLVLGDHAHTRIPELMQLDSAKSIMRNLPRSVRPVLLAYWLNPSGGYHVSRQYQGNRFQWQLARQH